MVRLSLRPTCEMCHQSCLGDALTMDLCQLLWHRGRCAGEAHPRSEPDHGEWQEERLLLLSLPDTAGLHQEWSLQNSPVR